jgi:preprotein translocase subunit SecY
MWTTSVSLVGGTVMLMWFGERITASGIGNGISLIIFVGIVSSLPSSIAQVFELSKAGVYSSLSVILFLVGAIAFLMLICFCEKIYRKVRIQYPNAAMMKSAGMADSSFLPLKLNMSGVIPPIFASSILMFPSALVQFSGVDADGVLSMLRRGGALYLLIFASLILFFSYFYSSIVFNTKEVASNLKKSNCFIMGIRPGDNTAKFLDSLISRITLIGALYLIFICVIPDILVTRYSIPLYIGGTGLLIMVNVVLDMVNQIQAHLYSGKYGANPKKRRVRVRTR